MYYTHRTSLLIYLAPIVTVADLQMFAMCKTEESLSVCWLSDPAVVTAAAAAAGVDIDQR